MATYKLIELKGIGEVSANLLSQQGLNTTADLLGACASKKGREELAEKTGLAYANILRWTNMADLFRLKGVGEEYSNLMEKAGVDTVKELRNRVAANLHAKIVEVNGDGLIVTRVPPLSTVESWVEQAKELEPIITH